jgi:hypothetical protein
MGNEGQVRGQRGRGRDRHESPRGGSRVVTDTGYLVSCWRGKLRSCRAYATLDQAREAAAEHVYEAADAFTVDGHAPADHGFRAAADWALDADPEPDRPAGRDLADGTRIRVRLVSADTARCLL